MITIISLRKYSQLAVITDELEDLRKRLDTETINRLKTNVSTLNKQYTKQVMKLSQLFWNVDDLKVAVDKLVAAVEILDGTKKHTFPHIIKHNYIVFDTDEIIKPLKEIKCCLKNVDEFKYLIKKNTNDLKSIVEPVKYIICHIEKGIKEYDYDS